jgi:hypothetical protein
VEARERLLLGAVTEAGETADKLRFFVDLRVRKEGRPLDLPDSGRHGCFWRGRGRARLAGSEFLNKFLMRRFKLLIQS